MSALTLGDKLEMSLDELVAIIHNDKQMQSLRGFSHIICMHIHTCIGAHLHIHGYYACIGTHLMFIHIHAHTHIYIHMHAYHACRGAHMHA